MKIQTVAMIISLSIDGESIKLKEDKTIDLEFSAIDTGGGFKDPILDFSFFLNDAAFTKPKEKIREIELKLLDPRNKENTITFSYDVNFESSDSQINGRLQDDQLNRDLIGFVLRLLR